MKLVDLTLRLAVTDQDVHQALDDDDEFMCGAIGGSSSGSGAKHTLIAMLYVSSIEPSLSVVILYNNIWTHTHTHTHTHRATLSKNKFTKCAPLDPIWYEKLRNLDMNILAVLRKVYIFLSSPYGLVQIHAAQGKSLASAEAGTWHTRTRERWPSFESQGWNQRHGKKTKKGEVHLVQAHNQAS